jgi:hypothetical protein
MLVAEIHRKGLEEARNHEDYLTSTVFGHLRYWSSPRPEDPGQRASSCLRRRPR